MAQFRIGVVGLGNIAHAVHLPGITASKDFHLTALCDIDEKRLKDTAEKYHIDKSHCFTDYRELIASRDVDAVDVPTPNDIHFQVVMEAIKAKKPYSVEKPVSLCGKDTEIITKATAEAGLKSMICFSYRFKTAARYARELVQNGCLGEIYHVSMQYLQAGGLPGNKAPLRWRFIKERAGSGALGDLGCHGIDLVRFVTGREYLKVIADADTFIKERPLVDNSGMGKVTVDDYCNYMARMEGGATATFQITRFGYGRGNYQRMEIYGSKGGLVYKLDESPGKGDELEICIGNPMGDLKVYTPVPVPARFAAEQMQSFADILNDKADGKSATIEDGLKNQKVLDAIVSSFEEQKWVSL
jgi:predicted dehydrogenase